MKTNRKFHLLLFLSLLLICLLPQAAMASEATVNDSDTFQSAVNDTAITQINITGDVRASAAIARDVQINVQNGAVLTLTFEPTAEGSASPVLCADITVANGGKLIFKHTYGNTSSGYHYLIVRGDLTINEGGYAELSDWTGTFGAVIFRGNFVNNGTFKNSDSRYGVYLNYGTTAGTFTDGYPIYNLCLTEPSDESISKKTIKITALNGTLKVGETISAEVEGFGDSLNLPSENMVIWDGKNYTNSRSNTYKIVAADAGSVIEAKFYNIQSDHISKKFPYDYISTKNDIVVPIHNGAAALVSETVPYLDTVYLGGTQGSDDNSGTSPEQAVATLETAVSLVKPNGTVIVTGEVNIPDGYSFLNKNINFTSKDGDTTYPAVFNCAASDNYSLLYSSDTDQNFYGLTFKNNAVFALSGTHSLTFDNVKTDTDALMTLFLNSYFGTAKATLNIKNSADLAFEVQNDMTADIPVIYLENASITGASEGSLGAVSLSQNSSLATVQPLASLYSDSTNNTLELIAADNGTPTSITIEGDVTASSPITLKFADSFSDGQVLLTSSAENSSLTSDKFKTAQKNTFLAKDGNNIIVKVKKASSGAVTSQYTVTFNSNGGSKIETQYVREKELVYEPKNPSKDGYIFNGWYSDEKLSQKYAFSAPVSGNLTLYAKWTAVKAENKDSLILTVGEKNAYVFGTNKTNDVAPLIVNDRTMLPARFVCENLGAEVTWDSVQKQVIITGKHLKTGADLRIVITIGASTATVNNQTVALDAPAFISDNRTYTPIRFICESLGADVTWDSTNQQIIITK